jgi:hypothetical protein
MSKKGGDYLNGITADLLVDFTGVIALAPDGLDAANNLFNLVRALCGRCVAPRLWLVVTLTRPSARRTPTTERRSLLKNARRKCQSSTFAATRDLDQKSHNSKRGEVGPIEA